MKTKFLLLLLSTQVFCAAQTSPYHAFFGVTVNNQKYAWYEEKITYTNSDLIYENKTYKKEGTSIIEEFYTLKVAKKDFSPKLYSFVRKDVGKKLEYSGTNSKNDFMIKAITNQNSKMNKEKFTVSKNFIFSSLLTFKVAQDLEASKEKTTFDYVTLLEDSYQTEFKPIKAIFVKDKLSKETLVGDDGQTHQVPCQEYQYKQYKPEDSSETLLSGVICVGARGEMISFKDPQTAVSIIPIPEKFAKVFFK